MTPAEEKRVRELTEEIAELKKHLTLKSAAMTNRDTSDELEKIGELLSEKNALTGLDGFGRSKALWVMTLVCMTVWEQR